MTYDNSNFLQFANEIINRTTSAARGQVSHALIDSKLITKLEDPNAILTRVFYNTSNSALSSTEWANFNINFYRNLATSGLDGATHLKEKFITEVPFKLTLDDILVLYIENQAISNAKNLYVFFEFYDGQGEKFDSEISDAFDPKPTLMLGIVCSGFGGDGVGDTALLNDYNNYVRIHLGGFNLRFVARNTLKGVNNLEDGPREHETTAIYSKHVHDFLKDIKYKKYLPQVEGISGNLTMVSDGGFQENYISGDATRTLLATLPYKSYLCREKISDDQLDEKMKKIEESL